jgi:hypothetical protein
MVLKMWTWLASLAGVAVAYSAAIWILKEKQHRDREQFEARTGEEEQDFVGHCGVVKDARTAEIVLGVRKIIAQLGGVPASSIHATDRFDHELEALKFRSEYHVEDFAELLKQQLNVTLDQAKLDRLADLEVPPRNFTVKDFVCQVLQFIQQAPPQKL